MQTNEFRLGDWRVDAVSGEICHDTGTVRQLQPKVMALLQVLVAAGGKVVSRQSLVDAVWSGRACSDEPINRCVAELRAALGDDCHQPRYVRTLARRGYQLLESPTALDTAPQPHRFRQRLVTGIAMTGLLIVLATSLLFGDPRNVAMDEGVRILVVPVTNAADPLLSTALTDELVSDLAAQDALVVMSRSAGDAYAASDDRDSLLEELRIDYLLEGTIRKVGDRYRMTMQLVDIRNRQTVVNHEFEEPERRLAWVASNIAAEVSRYLGLVIENIDSKLRYPGIDAATYREFIEAKHFWSNHDEMDARQAISRLDHVIERYPLFAEAYAVRAASYAIIFQSNENAESNAQRHLLANLEKAFSLDPEQPLALALHARFIEFEDPLQSIADLEKVVRKAPDLLEARLWLATSLYRFGYLAEALDHLHYAHARNPFSPNLVAWLADVELAVGRMASFDALYGDGLARRMEFSDTALFARAIIEKDQLAATRYVQSRWSHSSRISAGELADIVNGVFDPAHREAAVALVHDALLRPRPITRYWGFYFFNLLGEHKAAVDLFAGIELTERDIRIFHEAWAPHQAGLLQSGEMPRLMRYFGIDRVWQVRGPGYRCNEIVPAQDCRVVAANVIADAGN